MFMSIVNTEHSLKLSVLEFYIIRAGRYIENINKRDAIYTRSKKWPYYLYTVYNTHMICEHLAGVDTSMNYIIVWGSTKAEHD